MAGGPLIEYTGYTRPAVVNVNQLPNADPNFTGMPNPATVAALTQALGSQSAALDLLTSIANCTQQNPGNATYSGPADTIPMIQNQQTLTYSGTNPSPTVNLPPNPGTGQQVTIINTASNPLSVIPPNDDVIDNNASDTLPTNGAVTYQWTGTQWTNLAANNPAVSTGLGPVPPNTITATGAGINDAATLAPGANRVIGADGTTGVKLPTSPVGTLIIVLNEGNSVLNLYAGTDGGNGSVNYRGAGVAGQVGSKTAALMWCFGDQVPGGLMQADGLATLGSTQNWISLSGSA